jgi:proteasome lid subunit RPN8/RPN11
MHHHVQECLPEEACGLLAGLDGLVSQVMPVENVAHSAVHFRMEPQAQVRCLLAIEAQGLELVGVYHSHPSGPETPSETDRAEVYDPEALVVIWCSGSRGWQARAFDLGGAERPEVPIEVEATG